MVQRLAIQACVSMGALGWMVMTPFRWRTKPLEIARVWRLRRPILAGLVEIQLNRPMSIPERVDRRVAEGVERCVS
jgi:hypothetical protein